MDHPFIIFPSISIALEMVLCLSNIWNKLKKYNHIADYPELFLFIASYKRSFSIILFEHIPCKYTATPL